MALRKAARHPSRQRGGGGGLWREVAGRNLAVAVREEAVPPTAGSRREAETIDSVKQVIGQAGSPESRASVKLAMKAWMRGAALWVGGGQAGGHKVGRQQTHVDMAADRLQMGRSARQLVHSRARQKRSTAHSMAARQPPQPAACKARWQSPMKPLQTGAKDDFLSFLLGFRVKSVPKMIFFCHHAPKPGSPLRRTASTASSARKAPASATPSSCGSASRAGRNRATASTWYPLRTAGQREGARRVGGGGGGVSPCALRGTWRVQEAQGAQKEV